MFQETFSAIDPLGREISIGPPLQLPPKAAAHPDIKKDLTATLSRPAMLLQQEIDNTSTFFYYRHIAQHYDLLVRVEAREENFIAVACTINPDKETLSALLRTSKHLY